MGSYVLLAWPTLLAGAANPDITIGGSIVGVPILCGDEDATVTAGLTWPDGVEHPVPGVYTWKASPGELIVINHQSDTVSVVPSGADSDTASIKPWGLSGLVALQVSWRSSSGKYAMPSTSVQISVIKTVLEPTAVSEVDYPPYKRIDTGEAFGATDPEPTTVEMGAYTDCANKQWKFRVTKAESVIGMGISMFGLGEASVEAATAENWRKMARDISPEAPSRNDDKDWWVSAATHAHEEVHASGWKLLNTLNFFNFKSTVEALTIDMSTTVNDEKKAVEALLALPSYTQALRDFHDKTETDYELFEHPEVDAVTTAAERSILDPIYQGILQKAAENGWE